jgi:hypothetical protein
MQLWIIEQIEQKNAECKQSPKNPNKKNPIVVENIVRGVESP